MSVSVIVPARNEEALIGEALESIAAQTVVPAEVILVDDGSTDATVEVARRAYPDVRVLRQAASGPAAALNRGIREARGSWLAFLDADDLWEPRKLEVQIEVLEGPVRVDGVLGIMESFACPSLSAAVARRYHVPEPQQAWSPCALLVRSEAVPRVGYFAEDLSHGYAVDWFDRARSRGLHFALPEVTVFRRRIRPGSFSQRSRSKGAYLEMARRAVARRRGPPVGPVPE